MTLIEFESKKGERRRSRLDLHKRMFIDSVPVKIRPKLIRQIQQRVASATE